jgi:hypothetical protein
MLTGVKELAYLKKKKMKASKDFSGALRGCVC